MGYRGFNRERTYNQTQEFAFQNIGQTATIRTLVSSSANAGPLFGASAYYVERTFTGIFGQFFMPSVLQKQTPGGQTEAGFFGVNTSFPFDLDDEIRWNNAIYRVESVSQPSRLNGHYITQLKRGSG